MLKLIKSIFFISLAACFGWFSYRTYLYFFDSDAPVLSIEGLQENTWYGKNTDIYIDAKDTYKIQDLSIKIDNSVVLNKFPINSSTCSYPFIIPIEDLNNGKHTLFVEAVDAARLQNKSIKKIDFNVDNTPLEALLLKQSDTIKVIQGKTLHIQFYANKNIARAYGKALNIEVPFCRESKKSHIYECFVPIATDEVPSEYLFTINIEDDVGNKAILEQPFQIVPGVFKTQTISLQSKKKYEEEPGKSEQDFIDIMKTLSAESPSEKLWSSGIFYIPCDHKSISTEYGVIRTSAERGKYQHNAVDLVSPPESSVWSCQDGRVVLKDRFVHTGNTIAIDHGCGIISFYGHLSDFAPHIEEGMFIKKGKPIGKIGKTGYATGYHLHWEIRIGDIPIDPLEWTKQDF